VSVPELFLVDQDEPEEPFTEDDEKIVRQVKRMWDRARQPKDKLHARWELFYKRLWEARAQTGTKSSNAPRANEIMPTVTALVGWMGDARPKILVGPSGYDAGSEFFQIADQLSNDMEKLLDHVARGNKSEIEHEKMFFDALTFGTGFFKAGWDPDLDFGAGDATVRRVDPWNIYPDPLATGSYDWRYLIEKRVISKDEAVDRYGDKARDIGTGDPFQSTDRPSQLDKTLKTEPMAQAGPIMSVNTQYGAYASGTMSEAETVDSVALLECWYLHEGEWCFAVVGGGELLAYSKATELFDFARPPYVRYVIHETGEFWGPSLVEFLISPQAALNDLLFHAHNNARLAGDPMFEEGLAAGTSRMRLQNRPGQRLPVQVTGQLKWMEPPPFPQVFGVLIDFWVNEIERISGLSGVAGRGQNPSRRESDATVDAMQEGSFTRVRNALRNLEHALRELGEMLTAIVAEHYTEPRILAIVGPEGRPTVLSLKAKHFYSPISGEVEREEPIVGPDGQPAVNPATGQPMIRKRLVKVKENTNESQPLRFSVWCEAGSALPTSRMALASQAMTLYAAGGIDRQGLLETLRWPGWRKILERVTNMEAQGIQVGPGARKRAR
jgi:hypothetical protein